MNKRLQIEPWWLADATERCSACGQLYAYHTEFRCIECDEALCPICVQTTLTLESVCSNCCGPSKSEVS